MANKIQIMLKELYKTFSKYNLKNLREVGFYDYWPTEYELQEISKPVKDISDKAIASMEFFWEDETWWTKEEVKYLLPRIFEYVYYNTSNLEDAWCFSYFKYKLKNSINNDFFNKKEKEIVGKYFNVLLQENFSKNKELGYLIELSVVIGYNSKRVLDIWEIKTIKIYEQLENLLQHFWIYNDYPFSWAKWVYIDNTDEFDKILNWIFLLDNK